MSGPKVTVYSLTAQQQRIITEQISCDQQSAACVGRIQELLKMLASYPDNLRSELGKIELLIKRTSAGAEQKVKIQDFMKKLNVELSSIQLELSNNLPSVSSDQNTSEIVLEQKRFILKRLQKLKTRAEKLKAEYDSIISHNKQNTAVIQSSIINDLESTETEVDELGYLKRNDEGDIQKIQDSIIDDLNGVYSFEMSDEDTDDELRKKKKAISDRLLSIIGDNDLSAEIISEVKNAVIMLDRIISAQHLKTFDSLTVKPLMKKAENYKREQEEKKKIFAEKYASYKALCILAQENPKELNYSDSHIEFIDAEIKRIEQQLIRQREQEYIHDSVDEVLSDMGYELIGSREVRKKSGKHFRNELYTFNEGTAVNVTFSSDGQISMELGGLAREDRIPSEEESKMLTEDMESFCSEFSEFEKRMLTKGIVVGNRIALSPPTADYVAIINVNDYDIDSSVQVSEMKATEKQRKQTKRKEMKIE